MFNIAGNKNGELNTSPSGFVQAIQEKFRSYSATKKSVIVLIAIWLSFSLSLFFLQLLGFEFGYKVLPGGEDWNWIAFIAEAKQLNNLPLIAHKLWITDGRNPLSPWYWIAIAHLIIKNEYALYMIRCLIDPLLAVSVYLLLSRLFKLQNTLFAFSVALIIMMWNFFINFSHLLWVFHCAVILSLYTLFFYCRYVDKERTNGTDLALALVCYFAAIATYSLQAGALIGISAIAFFRKPFSSEQFGLALIDISFFFVTFIIFYLIWNTTTPWIGANVNSILLSFHWHQLIKSSQYFLFHYFYLYFFNLIFEDWHFTIPLFMILTAGFAKLLSSLTRSNFLNNSLEIPLLWVVVLLLSIAGPVLMLESSSAIFLPGVRSPMISQVFQPLLYVTFIFILGRLIPLGEKAKDKLIVALISLLAAITTTISVEYNHSFVKRTIIVKNLKWEERYKIWN